MFLSLALIFCEVYLSVIYTIFLWQLFTSIYVCLVACHQHPVRLYHLPFKFVSNQHLILFPICALPYNQMAPNRKKKQNNYLFDKMLLSIYYKQSILLGTRIYKIRHYGHNCPSHRHRKSSFRLISPSGSVDTILFWPFALTEPSRVNQFLLPLPTLSFAPGEISGQCLIVCNSLLWLT